MEHSAWHPAGAVQIFVEQINGSSTTQIHVWEEKKSRNAQPENSANEFSQMIEEKYFVKNVHVAYTGLGPWHPWAGFPWTEGEDCE